VGSDASRFAVRIVGRDTVLASDVATARSVWSRFRGLMGRSGLEEGEGLWFPGDTSIHMLFMRFTIDALFLGPDAEPGVWCVVAVHSDLPPWRGVVWWVRSAKGCLELAAGRAAACDVAAGDRLRFEAG
jgi:uncharacterized membrane protein (UPF0127 family)